MRTLCVVGMISLSFVVGSQSSIWGQQTNLAVPPHAYQCEIKGGGAYWYVYTHERDGKVVLRYANEKLEKCAKQCGAWLKKMEKEDKGKFMAKTPRAFGRTTAQARSGDGRARRADSWRGN